MVEMGARRYPDVQFRVGSLLALPATDAELAGAVALYSILHLRPEHRAIAYREMARVIRPGGWLLVAFHIAGPIGHKPGDIMHAEQWWGEQVDLDFYYLDPDEVAEGIAGGRVHRDGPDGPGAVAGRRGSEPALLSALPPRTMPDPGCAAERVAARVAVAALALLPTGCSGPSADRVGGPGL